MLALLACPAAAEVYTGSMNYPGDSPATLDVDGQDPGWLTGFTIDWQVSNEETGGPGGYDWFYEYTIDVIKFAPRRLIVETAGSFTAANISTVKLYQNTVEQVGYSDWSVGSQPATDPPNKDMPEAVYGILFDAIGTGAGNNEEVQITFWSDVAPGWGDFYSRCDGNGNRAFNLGFTTSDPTDPPSSGVNSNHLLVPIPEPSSSALVLSAMAVLAFFVVRRRR